MTHRYLAWGTLLGAALVGSIACGGKSEEAKGFLADDKDAACEDFCAHLEECGEDGGDECLDACVDNSVVSNAGQDAITECYLEAGCDMSNPLVLAACLEDALDELPVSKEAETFCDEGMSMLTECLGEDVATAEGGLCLDGVALVSDPMLEDLNGCTVEGDCESLELCLGLAMVANVGLDNLQMLTEYGDLLGGMLGGDFGGDFGGNVGGMMGEDLSGDVDMGDTDPWAPDPEPAPVEPGMGGSSSR